MASNNKSNSNSTRGTFMSRFLELLSEVNGWWWVIITLAAILAILFAHWAGLMLITAIEAIVASAKNHFGSVFTMQEVLIITGAVILVALVMAAVKTEYCENSHRRDTRPVQHDNRVPQRGNRPPQRRDNHIVGIDEHRSVSRQKLQHFDVAE